MLADPNPYRYILWTVSLNPTAGSGEVTDLGPNDATDATAPTAQVRFSSTGSFKVCYKEAGGMYHRAGGTLEVLGKIPSSFTTDGDLNEGRTSPDLNDRQLTID